MSRAARSSRSVTASPPRRAGGSPEHSRAAHGSPCPHRRVRRCPLLQVVACGRRCYPSLEALPAVPEAVVAAVRIDRVPDVLRQAAKAGTLAAVVPGGGFSESGPAATVAQREIAEIAAEYGLAVAGPNCMGVIAPGRSAMYIGSLTEHLSPGRVAVVSP